MEQALLWGAISGNLDPDWLSSLTSLIGFLTNQLYFQETSPMTQSGLVLISTPIGRLGSMNAIYLHREYLSMGNRSYISYCTFKITPRSGCFVQTFGDYAFA